MNDFDRLLEIKLRHLLDPVVIAAPPPRRGKSKRTVQTVLAPEPPHLELAVEAIPVRVEPVAIAVPATRLHF
jgi:hypothetical protein